MNIKPFVEAINRQKLGVEGIVVLQRGEQIAEHRWVPETPKNVFSVSKSFSSMAVGMAIDEGKLALPDRVLDAFPGLIPEPGPLLEKLTLENLLTMSRGFASFSRPDTVAEALAQPLSYEPGSHFIYDNASTFLASAMVTRATGLKVRDYLLDRLFRPLDIPDPVWQESNDGYTVGATGLEVTTTALSRFGQFLLQRGSWKGKQLVSASWIDGATRTQISNKEATDLDWNMGYGYYFWTCRYGAYRADGANGQYVIVLPRQEAVIAINSNEENMKSILYEVWNHIRPLL
jgi:CubicO group peptidase (beta-lactamase class C family)